MRSGNCKKKQQKEDIRMNDMNSLAHTSWNCKYHIVFAPKYRRKVFYGEKRAEIGKILRMLCEWKKVEIVEAEVCKDHVHMLVKIPPKIAVLDCPRFNRHENKNLPWNFKGLRGLAPDFNRSEAVF